MEQTLEASTEEGGWKLLVTSVMWEAVTLLSGGGKYDGRDTESPLVTAREWVRRGNQGEITFDESAELLGYEPDILREKILSIKTRVARKPAYRRDYARLLREQTPRE